MPKELVISAAPHETRVAILEDGQLCEIYIEREKEFALVGSIYKGRVTRVLPGMQSAFVDIGLERDAFLYVSDFRELEEHDDDLTDVVPASRAVPDLRQQPGRADADPAIGGATEIADASDTDLLPEAVEGAIDSEGETDAQPATSVGAVSEGGDSQNRERGSWRGRPPRRGGRRDGRGDGRDRGPERTPDRAADRVPDRGPEPRFSRPVEASSRPF